MSKNRNAVRAGLFMLASLAGVIFIVIAIEGAGRLTEQFHKAHVGFRIDQNIGGLRKGDDVRVGGLKVGTVDNIRFVHRGSMGDNKPEVDGIVVTLDLPDEYKLAKNAKVGIERGVTGVVSVNISDLGYGDLLADNDALPGRPDDLTTFLHALGEKGPVALDDIHTTLGTYNSAGKRVSDDVHSLAFDIHSKFREVAFSARGALDAIHDLLGPSTQDFHASMANVRDLTGGLRRDVPHLMGNVSGLLRHVDGVVVKVSSTLDDVQATAANAKDLSAAARAVVVRNKGRFDGIVAGLKKTSDNLDAASVEIRSSPWRLLYKPTPDEMSNLNLYDAARQFAEGANDLNDAATALHDSLRDKQSDPEKVQKLYDNLMDHFSKFKQVEDALWKKVRE